MSLCIEPQTEHDYGYFDVAQFAREALSSSNSLASVIDHALLRPDATRRQVEKLCEEAAVFRFASATVNPAWVSTAHSILSGTGVHVGVVVGSPLGASLSVTKREEAMTVAKLGARELEMVMNVGMLESGMNALLEQDIHGVAEVAHEAGATLKVALEITMLNVEEKLRAAELVIAAGADYLETGSGFSSSDVLSADVALLRGVAGRRCGVKAAGGMRTLAEARIMLEAGANRLGTGAGVAILSEY